MELATAMAKRYGADRVEKVHLLAAIKRWESGDFNERFAGIDERLEPQLDRTSGTASRPSSISDSVTALLDAIFADDDAWTVADQLVKELEGLPVERLSNSTSPKVTPDGDGVREQSASAPAGLVLDRALADLVASAIGGDPETVYCQLSTDAATVAKMVHGSMSDAIRADLAALLGAPVVEAEQLSNLVAQVSASGAADAARLATKVAVALVDVGEWVAAHDQEVTTQETDRIDGVRLLLRAQLNGRIDATSDAIASFEKKFADLIGLESVKTELRKRVDYLLVNKRREARSRTVTSHRMHMAFVGNPGTGKTTVARLFGELLKDVGLLEKADLVETDRSGLVGEYVGHTEKKTMDVVKSADGGILFVDEAYALNDKFGANSKGFGEEAIDVLVKQMEDRRDRLVVIFAGYKEPMAEFLSVNPGLKSRVPLTVDFPDYTAEQLIEIAGRIAERRGLELLPESSVEVGRILASARGVDGFGNARAVENIMDGAERNLTARLSALGNLATEEERRKILPEDIPLDSEVVSEAAPKQIGFMRRG